MPVSTQRSCKFCTLVAVSRSTVSAYETAASGPASSVLFVSNECRPNTARTRVSVFNCTNSICVTKSGKTQTDAHLSFLFGLAFGNVRRQSIQSGHWTKGSVEAFTVFPKPLGKPYYTTFRGPSTRLFQTLAHTSDRTLTFVLGDVKTRPKAGMDAIYPSVNALN